MNNEESKSANNNDPILKKSSATTTESVDEVKSVLTKSSTLTTAESVKKEIKQRKKETEEVKKALEKAKEELKELAEKNERKLLILARKTKKRIDQSNGLIYLGFVIMLLMIVQIIFSYQFFIFENNHTESYKNTQEDRYNMLTSRIIELEKNSENIKQSNSSLICMKDKGYFTSCIKNK